MQSSSRKQLRFILIFLFLLALFLFASRALLKQVERRHRSNASFIASSVVGRMQGVYQGYLIAARNMEGYILSNRGDYEGIEGVMDHYLQNVRGIASLQVAPGAVTSLCLPAGSGRIGYDILSEDAKKDDAAASRDGKRPLLSGPYSMGQGGVGFVLRCPVFMRGEGADGGESFWGFASVVVDMGEFFAAADIKKLGDQGYSYQMWVHDKADDIVFDSIAGNFAAPARTDFSFGGKGWSLYMEPVAGWIGPGLANAFIAGSFLLAAVLALLDMLVSSIFRTNVLLKNQAKQLRLSEENERNLRNIYEASVESAELFLWEISLRDGSARLMNNPYTQKISEAEGIPQEIPSLMEFARGHCPKEDGKVLEDIFSRVRHGDNSISEKIHFLSRADRQLHTLKISYTVISDEYGKPVKSYGTAQDVTSDSAKRDGYNQELAFFASYQGMDMVIRARIDLTSDKILDTNPAVDIPGDLTYTGLTQTNGEMGFVMDDGKQARELLDRNGLLQKFSMGIRSFSYDYRTGKVGANRSWTRAVIKLFESPDNGHVEMFFYAYDISEQKNEMLLIGRIINSVYEKIGIIDLPEGVFRNFMVRKAIVSDRGMSYDEYMQSHVAARYIPEAEQAGFREAVRLETVRRELGNQELYTFTTPYLEIEADSGEAGKKYKMIRFCYLDDLQTGIIVCISDVTRQSEQAMEQKEALMEALDKAESANKAKSEFVSRISHDIRTPIGAIQNLTQFAKRDVDDKEKLLHDLAQIETSNKFLLSLINDVLDISKVDKGQIKLTPEIYPYDEYIESIRNIMEPMCMNKGLHWKINTAGQSYGGAAIIDRIRLNQIALNIISNAVKYTPECGEVSYTSKSYRTKDGDFQLSFEVKDTGIGMSEEFQKHMFEEFSQEYDNSQRPKGITGTGLGLAIVKRMVDLMGGTLSIASQQGVGTTVNVMIPCEFKTDLQIKEAQKKDMELEQKDAEAEVRLPGKVLLAEDNPINTEIAMTLLDLFGCKADHAENGKEAVELFAFSKPGEYSVILMDIQMPFMDGYEATRRIRALKRDDAKSTPIVAMTADAFEDARQKAYDAGVDDYMTKPLNPKSLKRLLLDISC